MMRKLLFVLSLLLTFPTFAASYYVRTDGSDTLCNGTVNVAYSGGVAPACAWAGINKCATTLTAGNECHVQSGVYYDTDGVTTTAAGTKSDNVGSGCTCTHNSPTITCSTLSGVSAGDYVQCDGGYGAQWTEVSQVSGTTITLVEPYFGATSSSDTLDKAAMIEFIGDGTEVIDTVISAWVPEPTGISWTQETGCVYSYTLASAPAGPWQAPTGFRELSSSSYTASYAGWNLWDENKNGMDSYNEAAALECPCNRSTLIAAVHDQPGSFATDGTKAYVNTWNCQDPDSTYMQASDTTTYGNTFKIAHPYTIVRNLTFEAGNADSGTSNHQAFALRGSATDNFIVRDVQTHNGKNGADTAVPTAKTDVLWRDVRALNGFNLPDGVNSGTKIYGLESRGGYANMMETNDFSGASAADPVIIDRFYLHRGFTNVKDSTCGQANNWVCEEVPGRYESGEKYTAVHGLYLGGESVNRTLDNILIQNCIIEITYDGIGAFVGPGEDVTIRNCTFYSSEYIPLGTHLAPGGGITMYNNAFHCQSGNCVRALQHWGSSNWDAVTSDYNAYLFDSNSGNIPGSKLMWVNQTDGYPDYTLDQIVQNEGEESHSLVVCSSGCSSSQVTVHNDGANNTRFTDTLTTDGDPTNWTPLPTSRLVNAGLNSQCPETDYYGNLRLDGACDIGAVEYQGDTWNTRVSILPNDANWYINGTAVRPMYGVRAANAMHTQAATDSLIANMDAMYAHGVRVISISLQGGNTGTAGSADQVNCYTGSGSAVNLSSTCTPRMRAIVEAADAKGIVIQLILFYQRIDQTLGDDTGVLTAIDKVAQWVTSNGYTNIIVDAANEHGHSGFDIPILDSRDQTKANSLCDRWDNTSNAPCAVSQGLGYDPYSVTGSIDYHLYHNYSDNSSTLLTGATAPSMNNEIDRYDVDSDCDQPGEFSSGDISTIEAGIQDAYTDNYSWFLHTSWTQCVHEGASDTGPRYHFGHNAGQPSTTDTNRSVHWAFDKMASVLGLTPDADFYVRTDGNDTACTGSVDAPYVSGTGPTSSMACAKGSVSSANSVAGCGDTIYLGAGHIYDSGKVLVTDTCGASNPIVFKGKGIGVTYHHPWSKGTLSNCSLKSGTNNTYVCDVPSGSTTDWGSECMFAMAASPVYFADSQGVDGYQEVGGCLTPVTNPSAVACQGDGLLNDSMDNSCAEGMAYWNATTGKMEVHFWNDETPQTVYVPSPPPTSDSIGWQFEGSYARMEDMTVVHNASLGVLLIGSANNFTMTRVHNLGQGLQFNSGSSTVKLDTVTVSDLYMRQDNAACGTADTRRCTDTTPTWAGSQTLSSRANFLTVLNSEFTNARQGASFLGNDTTVKGLKIHHHHNHGFTIEGRRMQFENVLSWNNQEGVYITRCADDIEFRHLTTIEVMIYNVAADSCGDGRPVTAPRDVDIYNSEVFHISFNPSSPNDPFTNGGFDFDRNVYYDTYAISHSSTDCSLATWQAGGCNGTCLNCTEDPNSTMSTGGAEFVSYLGTEDDTGDWHLKSTARGVDFGSSTWGPTSGTDLEGDTRTGAPDAGMDEYTGTVSQTCGNNIREGTEVCDGPSLGGATCVTEGFDCGTLTCATNCLSYTTTACINSTCGNALIECSEVCDGANLDGETCESLGFPSGTLACGASCTSFDTSACVGTTPTANTPWRGVIIRGGTFR